MSKSTPAWKKFEALIADIQSQLEPEAEVRHNNRLVGCSGRQRQLDVTISKTVSLFPVFIVIECKRYKRAVGIGKVEEFAQKLIDVKATLGVMVSATGFAAGARAIAAQNNIILQTYRQASDRDWKELVGESAWATLTLFDIDDLKVVTQLKGEAYPIELPFSVQLYTEAGEPIDTLKNLFWSTWKTAEAPRPYGKLETQIAADVPVYIRRDGVLIKSLNFLVSGRVFAKSYMMSLHLGEGNILEDSVNKNAVYKQVASVGFDWGDIARTQPSIELTEEEHIKMLSESKLSVDISNARRFIRVVFTDKKAQKTF